MPLNRLLIIDDEAGIAATIGRVARRCGFDSIITTDAEDFLARDRSWQPTVIVLDLFMPDVPGTDLLIQLGREDCRAQILIVSGGERSVIDAALELGRTKGLSMVGVIEKPLRVEVLRAAFDSISESAGILTRTIVATALYARQFEPAYQPMIDLATMRVLGVEVLARWTHPTRGPISPDIFIPMIEEAGLIHDFTTQMVERALKQLARWNDLGLPLRIAINVSAKNLGNLELGRLLVEKCAEFGVNAGDLTIELTESAAMEHSDDAATFAELVSLGARLSIDDFGTGYSSLVRLIQLPFAELKIDRSFVKDCLSNRESALIVRAVIDLAHNMDLKVVAEGVETAEVLQHLVALGCDYAQGYFFSKALEAGAATAWLLDWNNRFPPLDEVGSAL